MTIIGLIGVGFIICLALVCIRLVWVHSAKGRSLSDGTTALLLFQSVVLIVLAILFATTIA